MLLFYHKTLDKYVAVTHIVNTNLLKVSNMIERGNDDPATDFPRQKVHLLQMWLMPKEPNLTPS
jgi:hypothetical protein